MYIFFSNKIGLPEAEVTSSPPSSKKEESTDGPPQLYIIIGAATIAIALIIAGIIIFIICKKKKEKEGQGNEGKKIIFIVKILNIIINEYKNFVKHNNIFDYSVFTSL